MNSPPYCGLKLAECKVLKVLTVPKGGHRRVACSLIGEQIGYMQDETRPLKYQYLYFWNERYWMMVWNVFLDKGANCVICLLSVNSNFMTLLCFCVNSYTISNSQTSVAVQNDVIFWLWMSSGSMDMVTKDLPVWHYVCPWSPDFLQL